MNKKINSLTLKIFIVVISCLLLCSILPNYANAAEGFHSFQSSPGMSIKNNSTNGLKGLTLHMETSQGIKSYSIKVAGKDITKEVDTTKKVNALTADKQYRKDIDVSIAKKYLPTKKNNSKKIVVTVTDKWNLKTTKEFKVTAKSKKSGNKTITYLTVNDSPSIANFKFASKKLSYEIKNGDVIKNTEVYQGLSTNKKVFTSTVNAKAKTITMPIEKLTKVNEDASRYGYQAIIKITDSQGLTTSRMISFWVAKNQIDTEKTNTPTSTTPEKKESCTHVYNAEAGKCIKCGEVCNHKESFYFRNDKTHIKYCKTCGKKLEAEKNHTYQNNKCSVCEIPETHLELVKNKSPKISLTGDAKKFANIKVNVSSSSKITKITIKEIDEKGKEIKKIKDYQPNSKAAVFTLSHNNELKKKKH